MCKVGEDVYVGEMFFLIGYCLVFVDFGLLLVMGVGCVKFYKFLCVVVILIGDELVEVGIVVSDD